MPSTLDTLLIAAGSGVTGGGITQLLRVRPLNKRDDAESAKALATAYSLLVDDLRAQIRELREENLTLRDRLSRLEAKLDLLTTTDLHDS